MWGIKTESFKNIHLFIHFLNNSNKQQLYINLNNFINSSTLKYNTHGYMYVKGYMESRMEEYIQKINIYKR